MPNVRGTDGTEDDLPTYIRKAFGRDRSWMYEGLCHVSQRPPGTPALAWVIPAGEHRVIDGVEHNGDVMQAIALPICDKCPQQWLCTRWAVDVDERTGTWGIAYKQLVWLKKQPDATTIVDAARVNAIPIQYAVKKVRDYRV